MEQRPGDSTLPALATSARRLATLLRESGVTVERRGEVDWVISLLENGCFSESEKITQDTDYVGWEALVEKMHSIPTRLSAVRYYIAGAFFAEAHSASKDVKLFIAADILCDVADQIVAVNDSLNMKHYFRTISHGPEILIHLPTTRDNDED